MKRLASKKFRELGTYLISLGILAGGCVLLQKTGMNLNFVSVMFGGSVTSAGVIIFNSR